CECFDGDAWSETLVLAELDAPSRSVIVAGDGRRVIGYASTTSVGDLAELLRIAVRHDARGVGWGRQLLDEEMRIARAGGARRMLLDVAYDNAPALRLYRSAGFTDIHRRADYYGPGRDALVLGRQLDTP
ncbi:MAG: GNAT family N-acetyltransferase, partial [Actinomycetia bacterium]|nr:GNAT family N-acetyltransferase [Actinomycetes bacterium]